MHLSTAQGPVSPPQGIGPSRAAACPEDQPCGLLLLSLLGGITCPRRDHEGKLWRKAMGPQEGGAGAHHRPFSPNSAPASPLFTCVSSCPLFLMCNTCIFFPLKQRIFLFNPCQSMQHMEGKVSKVTFKRQLGKLTCFKNPCVSSRWELAQTRRYLL